MDQATAQATTTGEGERYVPVGRARERELLDGLLAALPDRGAALLLSGDPGIGKTTMLDYVEGRSRTTVLRSRGLESEAVLPYIVLADLLLPLRRYFAELPPSQRRALEASLALADATAEPNPYAVCAGALGVLAIAGEAEPLVVIVDDVHWADPSSRQVLQFVARRLLTERVALVMGVRSDPREAETWEGVPRVTLGPLTEQESWTLLRHSGLDEADPEASRLVGLALGNPLVLVEYAAAINRARNGGAAGWDEGWDTPGPLLERAWWGVMRSLPRKARTALLYVAACRTSQLAALERVLCADGLSLEALDAAEAAGLVMVRDGSCRLRHPVLRHLVLRRCSTARRLRVFRVLAEQSSGDLRTWYLAAAAPGPDEEVALLLDAEAQQGRQRGALVAAAHVWHRAAELSPEDGAAARRLLNAARDALYGGDTPHAVEWCEQALRRSGDPCLTADIELLRGQACTWLGHPGKAHRLLAAAARTVEPVDRFRARVLYGAAAAPATMDGRLEWAADITAYGQSLTDGDSHQGDVLGAASVERRLASVMRGKVLALLGEVGEARRLLLKARTELGGELGLEDRQVAVEIGQALSWTGDVEESRRILDAVIDQARRDGIPALLPHALLSRCDLESWSRWPLARADGTEALRWAQEFGHTLMAGYASLLLARLDAQRGDRAGCEEHVAYYERQRGDQIRGLRMFAQAALGSAALTGGNPEECRVHLEEAFALARQMGLGNPVLVPYVADLVEAHARAGNRERAAELADWIAERARATGLFWPRVAHVRCRLLLADSADDAERWLGAAEETHSQADMPFELARSRLAAGVILRRHRRPAAAREPLVAAERTFTDLGARQWATRAAEEAVAAGHHMTARSAAGESPAAVDLLTPQELQVARAVGAGLSNVEAAAALFLSRKTIEAHLTRVYRKLGVRSRSELAGYLTRTGLVS
ncbi:AAA family ATPase [Streptomyces sp. NPDC055189]